jgi:CRISPR-associated protein Cas1
METIHINEENCRIHRSEDYMLVKKDGRKLMSVPLIGTETVIVNSSVQFTTQALDMFLDKGIDVIFMNASGRIKGRLFSQKRNGVVIRMAQYDCFLDTAKRLEIARSVVRGKITNQRAVIKKYRFTRQKTQTANIIKELGIVLHNLIGAKTIDEIMGHEGMSARIYFEVFNYMLKRDDFTGRKYRHSPDIVNSALNLGYAFLANEVTAAIHAQKLDEELGFLHSIRYGRNSLSLDLMEEFRAPFIDTWIIRMFNKKILTDSDFHAGESGFLLTKEGYRKFCERYYEHIMDGRDWKKTILTQSNRLRSAIMEGSAYEPFEY